MSAATVPDALPVDFNCPADVRRRRAEITFYRLLACAALLGIAPVLALGWHIDAAGNGLATGNRLLDARLRSTTPQVAQVSVTQERITVLGQQLSALEAQALRRAQAGKLLRVIAAGATPQARLTQLVLLPHRVEMRGNAQSTAEVERFVLALSRAGLEGVSVTDLRLADKDTAGRYDFALSAPREAVQHAGTNQPVLLPAGRPPA